MHLYTEKGLKAPSRKPLFYTNALLWHLETFGQDTPSLKLVVDSGVWFPQWIFFVDFFVHVFMLFSLENKQEKSTVTHRDSLLKM